MKKELLLIFAGLAGLGGSYLIDGKLLGEASILFLIAGGLLLLAALARRELRR